MLSNRIILTFLGIIFFLIVILTSNRISAELRERFGGFIPGLIPPDREKITPTPTPTVFQEPSLTPTLTPIITDHPANNGRTDKGGTSVDKIPATGPSSIALLLLGGSLGTGVVIRRFSQSNS